MGNILARVKSETSDEFDKEFQQKKRDLALLPDGREEFFWERENNIGNSAGDAVLLDGEWDYLRTSDIDLPVFTLEAWIYKEDESADHNCILAKWYHGNDYVREFMFSVMNGNYLRLYYSATGNEDNYLDTPAGVINNYEWHHVAATLDGEHIRLYIDGETVAETTWNNTITTNGNHGMWIGTYYDNNWSFGGRIDEVRVWNIARNQTEIQNAMYSQISSSTPGLAGYWTFDGHFVDMSGLGNAAVPSGDVTFIESEAPISQIIYSYDSEDVPKPVGPANGDITESILEIEDEFLVGDLNLILDIGHTYAADLTIELISPAGTEVLLSSFNGGNGDNYEMTTFDDEAYQYITSGSAPFNGAYIPYPGSLTMFDGEPVTGEWTLRITDFCNGDGGWLNAWGLEIRQYGPAWLQPAPLLGNLVPLSGDLISCEFNTRSFLPGIYYADILVNSNDPVQPQVTVTTSLEITGNPEIYLPSDSLLFELTYAGLASQLPLVVYNLGNGVLEISDVVFSDPAFSVEQNQLSITVGVADTILVNFTPEESRQYSADMNLISNDDPITIYLQGNSLYPPAIGLDPALFEFELESGMQETASLNISNTGENTLIFQMEARTVSDTLYDNLVYVAVKNANQVAAVESQTGEIAGIIDLLYQPDRLKLNSNGTILCVTGQSAGYASILPVSDFSDTLSNLVNIELGGNAISDGEFTANCHDLSSGCLYIGNPGSNLLQKYDLAAGEITEYSFAGVDPQVLALSSDGKNLFILSYSYLHVFNTFTEEFTQIASGYNTGYGMCLSPDGDWLYTLDRYNLRRYDARTYEFISSAGGYNYGRELSMTKAGDLIAAADINNNRVRIYDRDLNHLADLTGYNRPVGVQVSENDGWCYVAERDDDELVRFDLETWDIDSDWTLITGDEPHGITSSRSFALEWAYALPDSGMVLPGTAEDIQMIFNAEGIASGDYFGKMLVSSNDPFQPEVSADLALSVIDGPVISVSTNSLIFADTIFVGWQDTLGITVTNTGYSELAISEITLSNPVFSSDISAFNLLPTESQLMNIIFTPVLSGEESGIITITSNAGTAEIQLSACGLIPPQISISDTLFSRTLSYGETAEDILTITNTGQSNLEFVTELYNDTAYPSGNAVFDGNGDYISVDEGLDWASGYNDFTISLWINFNNLDRVHNGIFARNDYQWIALEYNHDSDHRLNMWIDSDGYSPWELSNLKPEKNDWLANTWYHLAVTRAGDLITIYIDGEESIVSEYNLPVYNPGDIPVFMGRSQLSNRFHQGCLDEIRFWDHARTQSEISSQMHSGLSGLESGLAGYWNFDQEDPWEDMSFQQNNLSVFGNTTRIENGLILQPSWLNIVTNPAEVIVPEETTQLIFDYQTAEIFSGSYAARIRLSGNDPYQPQIYAEVDLAYTGQAEMELMPDSLDFAMVYLGASAAARFTITNTGTDSLQVSSILTGNDDFVAEPQSFILGLNQSREIEVTYTPTAAGEDLGEIQFVCNAYNAENVSLNGFCLESPQISVEPELLADTLYCGDTSEQLFTISNNGPNDLYYQVICGNLGDGRDGVLNVSAGEVYYVDNIKSSVSGNNPAEQNELSITDTTGFQTGDDVILITMQDPETDMELNQAGSYEIHKIIDRLGYTLILENNLQNNFDQTDGKKHQVIRIPQFTDVLVDGVLTCESWNGETGGVVCCKATGTVNIGIEGAIDVSAKGYRGHNRQPDNQNGFQGESILGIGIQTTSANQNGGGGGPHAYAGGGGGGHAQNGEDGATGNNNNYGFGGLATGTPELSELFMGGAGGTGGDNDSYYATNPNGGFGGGIIYLAASNITGAGIISANGGDGNYSYAQDGGAGGGAGGTVWLRSSSFDLPEVQALGGTGFTPTNPEGGKGGNGSGGRIRIDTGSQLISYNIIPQPYQGIFNVETGYWISTSPNSGTVLSGESADITAYIDAASLDPGIYESHIVISSNDVANPVHYLPVNLMVMDAVSIVIKDTLALPATYIDTTSVLPLQIISNGSSEVNITDIDVLNYPEVFLLSDTTMVIAPNGRDTLWVTFSPQEVISYNDILQIICDDPTDPIQEVVLSGYGLDDPVIDVYPAAYEITVLQNDFLDQTLTINNIGGDILTGTINPIVADTISGVWDGFDDEVWNDTWTGSNNFEIGLWGSDYVSAPLSLNMYSYNSDSHITSDPFIVVDDYLRIGVWYKILQSEINCDFRIYWQKNDGDFNHVYTSPVNQLTDWTYALVEIEDVEPGDQIRVRLYGNVGSSSSSYDQFRVLIDDVMFAPLFEFISFSEHEFTVQPQDQQVINCTFHADGFPFSTYPAEILIRSNDPQTDSLCIPVNVYVPPSDISYAPYNFVQNVHSGDQIMIYPEISNEGLSRLSGYLYQDLPDYLNGNYYRNFENGLYSDLWLPGGSGGEIVVTSSYSFSPPNSLRFYAYNSDRYLTSIPINMTSSYLKLTGWLKVTTSENGCDFRVYFQKNGDGFELMYDSADNTTFNWTNLDIDLSGLAEAGDLAEIRLYANVGSSSSSEDQFDCYLDDLTIHLEGGFVCVSENYFDLGYSSSINPQVTLKAANMQPDIYDFGLNMISNDPDEPLCNIPVELTVLNASGFSVSTDSLDFGNVFVNSSASLSLSVTNIGSDTLLINNIMLDSPVFSCALSQEQRLNQVLPGEFLEYTVTFSPETVQTEEDSLVFVNNDPTDAAYVVKLTGSGTAPPQLTLNPPSLELDVITADSIAAEVTLINIGESTLDYELYPHTYVDPEFYHYAYVTNYNSNSVSIINLESMTVQTISGFYSQPHNVDIDPAGENLWITYLSDNEISVYDIQNGRHKVINCTGSQRLGTAFSPDGQRAYVGDIINNRIEVYAADSLGLIATFSTDLDDPKWPDITPDGKYLYICDSGTDRIVVMDTENYTQVTSITGFTDPWGLEISPNGQWFAFRDGNNVQIGETGSNSIIAVIPDISNPRTPAWSPDNKFLYIGSWDSSKIYIAETDSFIVVQQINMPSNVWSVNVTDDNRYLLATLANIDDLAVIDLASQEIGYLNVGDYPTSVATFRTDQPLWLNIPQEELWGQLLPGETTSIDLLFNSTLLSPGDYLAELVFASNDPLNEELVYDITISHNADQPHLYLSQESAGFDPAWVGFENTVDITLMNTGTQELTVSNIVTDLDIFYLEQQSLTIPPDSNLELTLFCLPDNPGSYNGTLILEYSLDTIYLPLFAQAYEPPQIDYTPQQISQTLLPDETLQQTITISNNGIYDLEYVPYLGMNIDKFFIGNNNKFTLNVWEPETESFANIQLLFNSPWKMEYSPNGRQLWVSYEDAGFVSVIDADTYEVIENIYLDGLCTSGIAFNHTGSYAYVGNWTNNRIEVINTSTFTWESSISATLNNPKELAATRNGEKLFVTCNNNSRLSVIDLQTNQEVASIAGYSTGYDLAVSPQDDFVYWVDRFYIRKVDTQTNEVVITSNNFGELRGIEISENGEYIYVCDYDENKVLVLETENLTQIAQIEGVEDPYDLALSFDRRSIYIVTENQNTVAVANLDDFLINNIFRLGANDTQFQEIRWCRHLSWIQADLMPDTLAAAQTADINLNIDMLDSPDGFYDALLSLYSNDPWQPVANIQLEILIGPNPAIVSINDVPDDEGGMIDIIWNASSSDVAGADDPVTYYSIWRKIDQRNSGSGKNSPAKNSGRITETLLSESSNSKPARTSREDNYEIVVSFVPALHYPEYSSPAPTLVDSTESAGTQWSVFKVCAHTGNPGIYYFSLPDSGYSINNTAINHPPVILLPDEISFEANTALEIDFSEYVSDSDNDPLELTVSGNEHVYVDIDDLMVNFSAEANWSGTETLCFTVSDNQARAAAADTIDVVVTPSQYVIISKAFFPGWNWFSVNVTAEDMSVNSVMNSVDDAVHSIKSQTQSSLYYPGMGWFGSLNVLNNLTFYKLDVINNINWQFTGLPVSVPETIYDLISGWNWISFAPQLPQDINFALTSLGNAGTNIKNQTESAIYYDGMGWFGSLTALLPQEGYMLRTSEDVEFIYPELIARNNRLLEQKSKVQTEPILRDFDPHLYEFNAVMIVSTPDELPENSRLVAYCQEEVRSLCQILDYSKPFGRKFYSLMLYSNFLHESAFQLFYQQSETDPLIPLELSFDFVADITMGDFIDPVIVQLHTTDNDQIFELTDNISAYPNPFNPFTTISFSLQQDGRILLDIYNIKAQKVETLLNEYRTAGQYRISWNAENLPSGIYLLKYSTDNSVIQRKLVLIK